MDSYYIKSGYRINEVNVTNDKVSDASYWNKERNLAAEVYQFPVYKFLCNYIREKNIEKVIDVGCGVGRKLDYVYKQIPNLKIIGIDQEAPIIYCKKTYKFGEWYVDDFEKGDINKEISTINFKSADRNFEMLVDMKKN